MVSDSAAELARSLNASCTCMSVDQQRLNEALLHEAEGLGLEQLVASHPHLFSQSAVFVDPTTADAMRAVVAAVERVVALPRYQARVLAQAHPHARVATLARGAFLGFDFHLSEHGPRLIEINTNAGGGLLNVVLRRAQRACCAPIERAFAVAEREPSDFFAMFEEEWRLARGARPLRRIAIVDDRPEQQYLYPEFVLFRRLCETRGVEAIICDAGELELTDGTLRHRGLSIDLVYNRLTDFSLELATHSALAEAYRHDCAVVTPHPRAYALYADKRRLAVLCDASTLGELGATDADAALLAACVPRTRIVERALRDELWRERKQLFFKPQTGFGAKAAYRGEGITKRVFEQILEQPYVAQELVLPSSRVARVGEQTRELKVDVRNFAYAGQVQLVCARLYHGQTTNFRSEGGGFAPIYTVP